VGGKAAAVGSVIFHAAVCYRLTVSSDQGDYCVKERGHPCDSKLAHAKSPMGLSMRLNIGQSRPWAEFGVGK
jgi:hypothetical protein